MAKPFSLTILEVCWHNYCFKVYEVLTCLCNLLSTTSIAQTKVKTEKNSDKLRGT